MFDLTTYVKKWRIRQLKTVFSTLDTLCHLYSIVMGWNDAYWQMLQVVSKKL